jgi:hypothetical protein
VGHDTPTSSTNSSASTPASTGSIISFAPTPPSPFSRSAAARTASGRCIKGPGANLRRVLALQAHDFVTFASLYNGPGQAAQYGSLIQSLFDSFQRLRPA